MQTSMFWDITTYGLLKVNWHSGGTCCLHLQGWRVSWAKQATCFVLVSCLAYSLTLKMEATCSCKMLVDFQWTSQRYTPEDRTLHPLVLFCIISKAIEIISTQRTLTGKVYVLSKTQGHLFLSLTPWIRVLFEKLLVCQLVKKFLAFYGNQMFITVFSRACLFSFPKSRMQPLTSI
jgi:hypothetical protein